MLRLHLAPAGYSREGSVQPLFNFTGPLLIRLQVAFEVGGSVLSHLQLALKLADLRRCALQLTFEFVDPRCPLPGRLD
jgi:hypothetical protein